MTFLAALVLFTASPDFAEQRAVLDEALLPRLVELADLCDDERLFGSRDRCYRMVLVLDPDHAEARKALRYRLTKGEWKQSASYREPDDADEEALAAVGPRIEEAVDGYRDVVLGLIEAHRDALGPAGIEQNLDRLIALDPDDTVVRERLGEARLEGEWVLVETVRAAVRQVELAEAVRESMAAVPELEGVTASGLEERMGLDWTAGFETERVRILGTVDEGELRSVARAVHASEDLVAVALGRRTRIPDGFSLYFAPNPGERERLVGSLGAMSGNRRQLLLAGYGGWIGFGEAFGEWSPRPDLRIDSSTRQAVGRMLLTGYGIDLEHGWAWEGIGLYMVELLIGTRLTWYVSNSRYAPEGSTAERANLDLRDPGADWRLLGRELYASEGAPQLATLLGRSVDSMQARDLLASYLLATFLIDGYPERVPGLLRDIGYGKVAPIAAFETAFGTSFPRVERRFRRWLRETADSRR